MPGRGDNNKHGSAGRGSSNQSNQPFVNSSEDESASNHARVQTGGTPSVPQPKSSTPDADRNRGSADKKLRPMQMNERDFNLMVDSVPYLVHVTPFTFNDEVRFYISINGGDRHVFTWDSEVGGLRAIDDAAASIPVAVEVEISSRLQSAKG